MRKVARKFREDIYVIRDNHRSHVSKHVKRNLDKQVRCVFLPFNAPKLNRIEDEFSLFQREVLSNRKFGSEMELIVAKRKWVNYRNRMGIAHVNR